MEKWVSRVWTLKRSQIPTLITTHVRPLCFRQNFKYLVPVSRPQYSWSPLKWIQGTPQKFKATVWMSRQSPTYFHSVNLFFTTWSFVQTRETSKCLEERTSINLFASLPYNSLRACWHYPIQQLWILLALIFFTTGKWGKRTKKFFMPWKRSIWTSQNMA